VDETRFYFNDLEAELSEKVLHKLSAEYVTIFTLQLKDRFSMLEIFEVNKFRKSRCVEADLLLFGLT
jgi:hypothetical protein